MVCNRLIMFYMLHVISDLINVNAVNSVCNDHFVAHEI